MKAGDPSGEFAPILRNNGGGSSSSNQATNRRATVGRYRIVLLATAVALILTWLSQFVVEQSGLRHSFGGGNTKETPSLLAEEELTNGSNKNDTETKTATTITHEQLLEREKALNQKEQELKEREEKLKREKEEATKQKQEEEAAKQKEEEERAKREEEEKRAKQKEEEEAAKQKEEEEKRAKQEEEEKRSKEEAEKGGEKEGEDGKESPDAKRKRLNAEKDEFLKRYRVYMEPTEPNENKVEKNHVAWNKQKAWNELSPIKQAQIENYRKEKALLLNLHPTHHGGTAFCSRMRKGIGNSTSPDFVCMGDNAHVMPVPPDCSVSGKEYHQSNDPPYCYTHKEMLRRMPWTKDETGPFVRSIRKYFHLQTNEFRPRLGFMGRTFDQTDWEFPELVSVVITRDPLSRILAGDGYLTKERNYKGYNEHLLNHTRWWDLAAYKNEMDTDNFFLRTMLRLSKSTRTSEQRAIRNHIEEGVERSTEVIMKLFPTGINETHYEAAKSLLDRMTFVLDIDCLNDGMNAMIKILRFGVPPPRSRPHRIHAKPKERIDFPDVFEYLVAKNEWDIALYEYSKTISLVKCDEL